MFGKWIQRGFLAAAATGAMVLFGQGCTVDQESQLFIRSVLAPQAPDCQVLADASAITLGGGFIDVALSQEYKAWLLLGNQLVARGSQDQVRTETSRIALKSAEVRITLASSGAEISAYTVPVTGFVDPSSGTEPGYGVTLMPIIDRNALQDLAFADQSQLIRLVANVKIEGRTLGGSAVKSNEFQFVVQACKACLIRYTSDDIDTTLSPDPTKYVYGLPNCGGKGATGNTGTTDTTGCFTGQDVPISCQLCKNSSPACLNPFPTNNKAQ